MSAMRAGLLRMVPRLAILATAVGEIVRGDYLYGSFCLVALVLTLVPTIHARRLDAGIPLSVELVLLWLMVADMTLGNWLGLYTLIWYDKALHLSSSVLVGFLGFLAFYVLHMTGDRKFHVWLDALAILLVTLGIGALWEISEYVVDQLFGRRTQGSPGMDALDDTMADLMLDAIGGTIAAVFGPRYIRRSKQRVAELDRLVAAASKASGVVIEQPQRRARERPHKFAARVLRGRRRCA